ncbi:hypothetical protein [uncultured Sphingomonas sp.]|uniref:hypothetical protein n=1 Tax=uncultured Sphingomonas sp. TaxID=158754 RepID=UPI0035CADE46
MPDEPLSEHCSLMARSGGPPKPKERPADCPPDAAYIKTIGKGGAWTLPSTTFPIVFEGGDGDDKVTVIGNGGKGVLVSGGKGNDSLTVESDWVWLSNTIGPGASLMLAALVIVLAAIVILAWRALTPGDRDPR